MQPSPSALAATDAQEGGERKRGQGGFNIQKKERKCLFYPRHLHPKLRITWIVSS